MNAFIKTLFLFVHMKFDNLTKTDNWVPEDNSTQATSAYIKCKHWIRREVRMVKTTILFIWDQLLAALIHLNFITLILICFKLMIPGVNYVTYDCSPARTTEVSLYWRFTLEENIIAVITQDWVIDDNLKRQIKNQTLTIRLFQTT